jgi:hypothetical protein
MTIRCPEPLADRIEDARTGSGLTNNDFVVGLLERAMDAGLLPAIQPADQERLPLSA